MENGITQQEVKAVLKKMPHQSAPGPDYVTTRQTLLTCFERVEVFPFVIGSLGSWFPPNEEVLRKLRIGWKYAILMRRLCVASAIAGSQDIWYRSTCSLPGTNVPSHLQAPDPPPSSAVPLNP